MSVFRTAQPFGRPAKVPPVPVSAPVGTRTFRLVDATPADWLLCVELDATGADIDGTIVKVAKTRELQRTHQDGQVDTLGRLHTFDRSLLQVVSRSGVSETWDIVPPFQAGDQIQAEQVVYSGASDGSDPITLQDKDRASRAWTVLD